MSNLYVKTYTGFYTHRKTLRLRAAIGDDAFWVPPRLWAYAVESQPDGIFEKYTAGEIASLIGYTRDASSMLQALLKAGFMDETPLRIHGWQEHNRYHATYAARAKKAATARWSKSPSRPSPDTDKDIERGVSIATSNASSTPPVLKTHEKISLEQALAAINGELRKGSDPNDYAPGSKKHIRVKTLLREREELLKKLGRIA